MGRGAEDQIGSAYGATPAALSVAASGSGAVHVEITPLVTPEEIDRAVEKRAARSPARPHVARRDSTDISGAEWLAAWAPIGTARTRAHPLIFSS